MRGVFCFDVVLYRRLVGGAGRVRSRKPIIGLAGGIGAGKTRVATEFELAGCLVISSDRLNHELLALPDVLDTLCDWWGPDVRGADGRPDRRRIAEIVFANADQKRRLEALVYPLIARRRTAMIKAVEENPAIKAIVIDSPLLFESNLDRECDTIVFVDANMARRRHRLQQERGWDTEETQRRERWQISLDDKRSRAEFVVNNDGPPERLGPQVVDILQTIVTRHYATD